MTIFVSLLNGKSYIIEHLIYDLNFADCGSRVGIYANPYLWKGDIIFYKSQNIDDCLQFVKDNFKPIAFT